MPCVFCGELKLTREHVWPEWLRALLPADSLTEYRRGHGDEELSTWKAPAATTTVRAVCGACNAGWMSDLEKAAQPILTPLIEGRQTRLDEAAQRTVGAWGVKTAMMLQAMFPETVSVPPDHYSALRERLEPPDNTQVFIAAYDASKYDTYYYGRGLVAATGHPTHGPEDTHGYCATLAIRHLTLQVLGTSIDGARFRHAPEVLPFIFEIWPDSRTIVWPPARVLSTPLLESFADHFRGSG